MNKIVQICIVLVGVVSIGLVGSRLLTLWRQEQEMEKVLGELHKQSESAGQAKAQVAHQLDYYAVSHNLEKEVRARFPYKARDESMIVLIAHPSSSPQSTP